MAHETTFTVNIPSFFKVYKTQLKVQIGTAPAAVAWDNPLAMTTPLNSANDTAAQAGLEKTFSDELEKGLNYAARSLRALNKKEQLTMLAEAEIAYQNAIYLSEQSSTPPESPIHTKLQQLGAFLIKRIDTEEEIRPGRCQKTGRHPTPGTEGSTEVSSRCKRQKHFDVMLPS